jgi:hypothetical protein
MHAFESIVDNRSDAHAPGLARLQRKGVGWGGGGAGAGGARTKKNGLVNLRDCAEEFIRKKWSDRKGLGASSQVTG